MLKRLWTAIKRGHALDLATVALYSLVTFWFIRKFSALAIAFIVLLLALWGVQKIKKNKAV